VSAVLPLPLTERVAEALRQGEPDTLRRIAPLLAAVTDLMSALGYGNLRRELAEALPHYGSVLELDEIRQVLLSLGMATDLCELSVGQLGPDRLPCLFIPRGESTPRVILRRQASGVIALDPRSGEETPLPERTFGSAVLLTDLEHDAQPASGKAFSLRLLSRFTGLLKGLVAMSFLTNLVALASPLFLMAIYDFVVGPDSLDPLPALVAGIALVMLVDLVMRLLRTRALALVAGRLEYLLGVEVFGKLMALPQGYTERASPDAQLTQVRQFDSIREFLAGPPALAILESPFLLLYLLVLWWIGGPLVWAPVVGALVLGMAGLLLMPWMQERGQLAAAAKQTRQHLLMETLTGLQEIKARTAESTVRDRFRVASAEAAITSARAQWAASTLETIAQVIGTFTAMAVVLVGVDRVLSGDLSTGGLVASVAITWRFLSPLQGLLTVVTRVRGVLRTLASLDRLMGLRSEYARRPGRRPLQRLEGRIDFERVVFRYGASSDPVMLGLNLSVKPREFLAVLGANGSGKSTLFKLLMRMHDPQGGAVLVDGLDVRQLDVRELRRQIVYVPQHPKLFRGTLLQNLRLGNPLATDEAIAQALETTGITPLIEALPDGLSTLVGDQHSQRIPSGLVRGLCLARALLADSSVILLDEPATALDSEGDRRLMSQLEKLKGHATIIMISHRPSHIRLADRAVLLGGGVVQNSGTPDELVAAVFGGKRS
jgi:ATP-binding cassette, subfamily C, bacterial LapB